MNESVENICFKNETEVGIHLIFSKNPDIKFGEISFEIDLMQQMCDFTISFSSSSKKSLDSTNRSLSESIPLGKMIQSNLREICSDQKSSLILEG